MNLEQVQALEQRFANLDQPAYRRPNEGYSLVWGDIVFSDYEEAQRAGDILGVVQATVGSLLRDLEEAMEVLREEVYSLRDMTEDGLGELEHHLTNHENVQAALKALLNL